VKRVFKNIKLVVLFESAAIMEYIDDITPPSIMPAEPIPRALERAKLEYSNEVIKNLYQFIFCQE
jgi:glutathione S-transferase